MATKIAFLLGIFTAILVGLFLFSAALNLGLKIPIGVAVLSFASPSASIAAFEIVIGIVLLLAALNPSKINLYVYGAGYLLALVGISEGLLSQAVQGFARQIHEAMIPFAIVGLILFVSRVSTTYKLKEFQTSDQRRTEIILVLQFFVGGLVTLGGAAFAKSGTFPIGTSLGTVHLGVGIAGLYGGYAYLKRKTWSGRFLIAANVVTIAYSAFAETLAEVYAFLEPGINDAFIGTIIAIIVSGVIIYLLRSDGNPARNSKLRASGEEKERQPRSSLITPGSLSSHEK